MFAAKTFATHTSPKDLSGTYCFQPSCHFKITDSDGLNILFVSKCPKARLPLRMRLKRSDCSGSRVTTAEADFFGNLPRTISKPERDLRVSTLTSTAKADLSLWSGKLAPCILSYISSTSCIRSAEEPMPTPVKTFNLRFFISSKSNCPSFWDS